VLKAIFISLLVPPVSLLFLTLFGLLMQRWYRRVGYAMACFGALSMFLLGLSVVADSLLVSLEHGLPLTPPEDHPPQAIVILGGDVQRANSEKMYPGPLSLVRERAGAALARQTGLPVLVTGGKARPSDTPLGELMADSLQQDFGVSVRWVERVSVDTWENAHLSAPILKQHGIGSIYVVTNAWHMRRALLAFADTGITVTAAPTHFDHGSAYKLDDFIAPDTPGWETSYVALYEWVGCALYAVRQRLRNPTLPHDEQRVRGPAVTAGR
jgi:uncharacterized SAM-binding protein YcdF (DUF218 family)